MVEDVLYEWILEEPPLNYRQKLQYFDGYLMIQANISRSNHNAFQLYCPQWGGERKVRAHQTHVVK